MDFSNRTERVGLKKDNGRERGDVYHLVLLRREREREARVNNDAGSVGQWSGETLSIELRLSLVINVFDFVATNYVPSVHRL
jgi:hypothetical protein